MADVANGLNNTLQVTVVVCVAPRETREQVLHLPAGSTVGDALSALIGLGAINGDALSQKTQGPGGEESPSTSVGVWGRVVGTGALLAHLDRVEIYRPLTVDPKVARRERFAKQGARTTGLFARSRVGGKSGY